MNRTWKTLAMTVFVGATAYILIPIPNGGFEGGRCVTGSPIQQEVSERESPEQMNLFYQMRLYGNPDVNVFEKLWATAEDPRVREQLSFRKSNLSLENEWECMGPVNISGRVRALAVHPTNPDIIYAASATGGVWKTTNGGNDWYPLTDQTPALACGAIAIDPLRPNRIFVGTGEPVAVNSPSHSRASPAYSGVGILRSEDDGASWTLLPWPNSTSMIHRIALHPDDPDTMLVASTSDLWKSTNGGQSWTRVLTGTATDVVYTPGRPSRVYAVLGNDNGSSSNGVYVSDAGGKNYSWVKLSNNFPRGDSTGRIIIAIAPSNPNRIYAAIALRRSLIVNDVGFFMVCVSNDGGMTWERRPGAIPRNFTNYMPYYTLAMAVSPVNENFVMLGSVDWWRSTNGGVTFTRNSDWSLRTTNPNSPRYVHADQHAIVFKPDDPNTIIIGSDGGVHVSTNLGDVWKMRTYGMITTQYYGISTDPTIPYKIYGGTQDQSNQRQSAVGDRNWSFLGGGDGCSVAVDPQVPSNIFIVVNGNPQRSTNSGTSFSQITNGLNGGPAADREYWWRPMAFHPGDRTTLYISSQYMYRMRNPSASDPMWQIISPDLTRGSVIADFHVPPANTNWMYTTSGDGKAYRCENIRAAEPVWVDISAGLPNRWLPRVTSDPEDHRTVYVAVSGYGTPHMFKSTDAGETWVNITGDFPDIPVGAVYRSPHDPNVLFAASDMGVWYTSDGGAHWQRYGMGLPNCVVYDMIIAPDGKLIAGTYGRGVWVTSSVLRTERTPSTPRGPSLEGNHPNPFSSSTMITFSLPERERVRITVSDQSGRIVRTLSEGVLEAGRYNFTFHGAGLPNGVYYCTMNAGGFIATRKLTLLR
ncbi:MAG: T9SS type A sorting domain-containing protein [Bacteroidota bacterium]|nr:T9SS type A sorting domain-containing protein [Bacteroidota bacterium]